MTTTSSKVYEIVRNMSHGDMFTSNSIKSIIKDKFNENISLGSVTGALYKLCIVGIIKKDHILKTKIKGRNPIVYCVNDTSKDVNIRINKGNMKGGIKGRTFKPKVNTNLEKIVEQKSLSDRLLDLAIEIQNMNLPLQEIPTQVLWNELRRRKFKSNE